MSRFDSVRRVGPLDRARFFRTLGSLSSLDMVDIAVLAENAREQEFPADSPILRSGDRVCAFHAITEGRVRVEGGEFPVPVELGPRDAFGFLSMLGGDEGGIDATAVENTRVLTIDDDAFEDILEDNFPILVNLVQNLARVTLAERRRTPPGAYLAPAAGFLEKKATDSVDMVERIALIRRPGSPFESASLEGLARLARSTPEVRFAAGETIWRFGDASTHAYIIVAGDVTCSEPSGRVLFRAGPGYPLGNLERFTGDSRWFTATAETDLLVLRGDTESLYDLIEDHFEIGLDFVAAMARNVVSIRRQMAKAGLELPSLSPS